MLFALLVIAETTDPISGGAGWAGAGLLSLVLSWLLLRHLPEKDRQLRELLDAQAKERELDRTSRHNLANAFQAGIAEVNEIHQQESDRERERQDKSREFHAAAYKEALASVLHHCQRENDKAIEVFRQEIGRVAKERQP